MKNYDMLWVICTSKYVTLDNLLSVHLLYLITGPKSSCNDDRNHLVSENNIRKKHNKTLIKYMSISRIIE